VCFVVNMWITVVLHLWLHWTLKHMIHHHHAFAFCNCCYLEEPEIYVNDLLPLFPIIKKKNNAGWWCSCSVEFHECDEILMLFIQDLWSLVQIFISKCWSEIKLSDLLTFSEQCTVNVIIIYVYVFIFYFRLLQQTTLASAADLDNLGPFQGWRLHEAIQEWLVSQEIINQKTVLGLSNFKT
jgi:hypothetical protein